MKTRKKRIILKSYQLMIQMKTMKMKTWTEKSKLLLLISAIISTQKIINLFKKNLEWHKMKCLLIVMPVRYLTQSCFKENSTWLPINYVFILTLINRIYFLGYFFNIFYIFFFFIDWILECKFIINVNNKDYKNDNSKIWYFTNREKNCSVDIFECNFD